MQAVIELIALPGRATPPQTAPVVVNHAVTGQNMPGGGARRGDRWMDASALIDAYCAVWAEPDPIRRAALLHSVWARGATYTDPTVDVAGADELLAHIAKVQKKRPGAKVVRTSAVSQHHHIARFA